MSDFSKTWGISKKTFLRKSANVKSINLGISDGTVSLNKSSVSPDQSSIDKTGNSF